MAFKTFADLSVLPASDLNTYLMKQAVIVCTSGTRPASPPTGMTVFETDTLTLHCYNGTAWRRYAFDAETNNPAQGTEATAQTSITSATFSAGSVNCFTTFLGPPSGLILATIHANCGQSSNGNSTQVSYEIRDSATPGAGSQIAAPSSFRCVATTMSVVTSGPAYTNGSFGPFLHSGLTPGTTYNMRAMHNVTGGTGTVSNRAVTVIPVL